jgi:hypothetical protein
VSTLEHGASGDAVAGVDLDTARLQKRSKDVDHVEALDLLRVLPRWEEEDGRSHFAPAHDELLTETLGVPTVLTLLINHPQGPGKSQESLPHAIPPVLPVVPVAGFDVADVHPRFLEKRHERSGSRR